MRFRALSLVAGVAVLALTAGGVLASIDEVDQHQNGATQSWDAGDNGTAQTFTAAVSGHLDRVALWSLTTEWTITGADLLSGGPTGTLLATSSSATSVTAGAWLNLSFSPTVQVTAGSTYAVVLHTSGAVRLGGTCDAGAYTRGDALGLRNGTWQAIPSVSGFDSCVTDLAFQEGVIPTPIVAPPTIAMTFGSASIPVGGTTTLTFTITNPNLLVRPEARPALAAYGTLTNIGFTDTLPAGLLIATPNNIGGSCGGAIIATAGTNLVSIAGLTLAPEATCGFGVDVIGAAAGTKVNTTSQVASTEAATGDPATASITVSALSTPTPPVTAAPTAPATAAPTPGATATPPPTATGDSSGPGNDTVLLPALALAAIASFAATMFVLRSESRVHNR